MSNQALKVTHHAERVKFWNSIILEWKKSGLSKFKFCQSKKISNSAFYSWYKKLQPINAHAPKTKVSNRNDFDFLPIITSCDSNKKEAYKEELSLKVNMANGLEITICFDGDNNKLIDYIRLLKEL
jgi:hypothetical protein